MTSASPLGTGLRRARRSARRVRQTVSAFDNGGRVLADLARHRISGSPSELTFALPGGATVTCPNVPGARVPVYEVFAEDAYRLDWFTGDLGPDAVALDIGGHIGCFALAFAWAHPGGAVHAYEASPTTAAYLARNVADNGLAARVATHAVALSDQPGTLEFTDVSAGSALNGLTAPTHQEGGDEHLVKVPAITFAEALAAVGRPVDVVKIDTEGAEYAIVLGSAPQDWAGVSRVVLEYHDVPGHGREELEEFLAQAGLRVQRHEPVTDRLGTLWLRR